MVYLTLQILDLLSKLLVVKICTSWGKNNFNFIYFLGLLLPPRSISIRNHWVLFLFVNSILILMLKLELQSCSLFFKILNHLVEVIVNILHLLGLPGLYIFDMFCNCSIIHWTKFQLALNGILESIDKFLGFLRPLVRGHCGANICSIIQSGSLLPLLLDMQNLLPTHASLLQITLRITTCVHINFN